MSRWLAPPRPTTVPVITDPAERRLVGTEILVVLTVTLGLSALRSALSLLNALLQTTPLNEQQVALNAPRAEASLVDLAFQLTERAAAGRVGGAGGVPAAARRVRVARPSGWTRTRPGRDALGAIGLAALIGIPGLGLYLVAHALGVSVTDRADHPLRHLVAHARAGGCRPPANAWAEEVIMIGWLLTRLRQLGWSENRSLVAAAVLRGSYHLYQGLGGFVGNLVMGCVFGRVWQRQGRLWCLVGAHTLIDVVAFVGYGLLRGTVSWLP